MNPPPSAASEQPQRMMRRRLVGVLERLVATRQAPPAVANPSRILGTIGVGYQPTTEEHQ